MQKHFYKLRFEADEIEWRARVKRDLILNSFEKFYKNSTLNFKMLDLGCGTGLLQMEFEKKNPGVTSYGIDVSKEAVVLSKKRGLGRVKIYDGKKIPFSSNFFNLVTAVDVLEHIKKQTNILKEIKRVLKKDGLGIFLVPADSRLWSTRDLRLEHFRRYDRGQLEKACMDSGLMVVSSKNIDFLLYFVFKLMHKFAKRKNGVADLGMDTVMTNSFLNEFFYFLLKAENFLSDLISYPKGLSKLIVVKKLTG